jgi:hypothetical protein
MKGSHVWVAGVLLLGAPAYADFWGGDIPILSGIFVQATEATVRLNESLRTARASYEEVRRLAGWAEEARDAFATFSKLNEELSGDLKSQFDIAFPDIGLVRDEAARLSSGGRWTEAPGEFRRLLRICIAGGRCHQAREALSVQQTRAALGGLFGAAPTRGLEAADTEAAVAIASGTAQEGRSARARAYAEALMRQCQQERKTSGAKSLASCQAAAAAADIAKLELDADIADGIAQSNRLSAMSVAMESERRKRDFQEAEERRRLLVEGAMQLTTTPPRVETAGFDFTRELR